MVGEARAAEARNADTVAPVEEAQQTREAYERQGVRWQDERYRSWMPGNLFAAQEGERVMLGMLRQRGLLPLDGREILEVGCGDGKQLARFLARGSRPGNLHGIDVQEDLVAVGREIMPEADVRVADATELPYADGQFDLVLAFTMLSSMRSDESRRKAASEMVRVIGPDGAVVVYDFAVNPRNADVQPVGLKDIRELFPGCRIQARRVTLAPPLARAVAKRSWLACSLLNAIPLLRTHRLALITP